MYRRETKPTGSNNHKLLSLLSGRSTNTSLSHRTTPENQIGRDPKPLEPLKDDKVVGWVTNPPENKWKRPNKVPAGAQTHRSKIIELSYSCREYHQPRPINNYRNTRTIRACYNNARNLPVYWNVGRVTNPPENNWNRPYFAPAGNKTETQINPIMLRREIKTSGAQPYIAFIVVGKTTNPARQHSTPEIFFGRDEPARIAQYVNLIACSGWINRPNHTGHTLNHRVRAGGTRPNHT